VSGARDKTNLEYILGSIDRIVEYTGGARQRFEASVDLKRVWSIVEANL
jgi:uncharacterized protein with HEPN domain